MTKWAAASRILNNTVTPKALEVYVVRLRKKLEDSGVAIITLRGLGYMLSAVEV